MLHSLFCLDAFAFFNFFSISISFSLVMSSIFSLSSVLSSSSLSICHTAFSCVPPNGSAKWSFHLSIFIFSLILSVFFFLHLLIYFHTSVSLFMFRIFSSFSCFFFYSLHHSLYSPFSWVFFLISSFFHISIFFLTLFSCLSIFCCINLFFLTSTRLFFFCAL